MWESEGLILFLEREMLMLVIVGDDFASIHDTIACFRNFAHFFLLMFFMDDWIICFEVCYEEGNIVELSRWGSVLVKMKLGRLLNE